jgi:hypothetical protein
MKAAGLLITADRGGKVWREWRHNTVPAIIENLDIHYAKTDGRRVNKDHAKNINVECWLEFGSVEYGYMTGDKDPADWDAETHQQNYHDWKLDTGGPTFDAALVKLAKNVLKVYGDYRPRNHADKCGRPCGDCRESREWMKQQRLKGSPGKENPMSPEEKGK